MKTTRKGKQGISALVLSIALGAFGDYASDVTTLPQNSVGGGG